MAFSISKNMLMFLLNPINNSFNFITTILQLDTWAILKPLNFYNVTIGGPLCSLSFTITLLAAPYVNK